MINTVVWQYGTSFFIVAPRSDDSISRKEDLFVKYALFDFLISTNIDL